MLDPLVFKGVSYAFIGLLAFTGLALSVVSLRKELIYGKPVHGVFPVVLVLASLCFLISIATAYVPIEINSKRAALTSK
jgi:hypothetical protein